MASHVRFRPDRRQLLLGGASVIGTLAVAGPVRANLPVREYPLTAHPARARLAIGSPEIDVWTYGGTLPGPEIRVKQGERLRVRFENRLREETTVHWHGIRLPNAMDGVGGSDAAARSHRGRPSSTSSSCRAAAPSCTTRIRMTWCRWRWA